MSQEIDRNVVEMRFDNAQFEQGVKTSMKTIDKLKQSLNFESAVKGLDQINSSVKKVDMSPMSQAVEQVQYKFNALDIVAATVISRLTNSLIDAGKQLSQSTIGQIMTGGWSRATNIDKAKFSMKGLGYEWEQYNSALEYAVNNTAFGLDSAAKAAASLVASNVSLTKSMGYVDEAFEDGERDVTEMAMALRAISGVAAQTNSDYDSIAHIFTTIAGNGRLMTEQLNQFSYRGMNAAATLADAMGVSETAIREMVRKGQIDFATFSKIMYDAFGEHAVAANETFEGALANMKAALSRIGADFAEHIRKYFIDPFNALRKMFNQVRQITKPFSKAFEVVMKIASSGATKLIESFTESLKAFAMDTDNWRESIPGISDLGMALYNTFHALYRIIKPIKDAFKTIFPRPTVEQIRAMAESIREFTERLLISDDTMSNLHSTFKGIFAIVKIAINIIKVLFKVLEPVFIVLGKGLDILLAITGVIGELLSGISGAEFSLAGLYDILNGLGAILAFIGDGIIYVITHISEFANNLAESVNITEAWNNALTFFQNILSKVSGAIEGISEFIKSIFKQLKPLDQVLDDIKTTFNNFVNTVKQKGLKVLENLEKVFKNLSDYIKGVKEDFLSLIDAMKTGDINTTISRFNEIFDKRFTNLLSGIGNTLGKIPGMFKSVFSSGNLLGSAKTDIQTMNEEVVELEKNLTGSTMDKNAKFAMYRPKDLTATSNALSVLRQQLSDVDESTEEVSDTVRKARFTDETKNITKAVNTMRESALEPTFGGKKSNNWLVDKIIKIKDAIVGFVKAIDWARIAGVAFLGLLFYMGVTITKVINSSSNLITSVSKMVDKFTEKLDDMSFFSKKKRNPLMDLAISVGIIAASIALLASSFKGLEYNKIEKLEGIVVWTTVMITVVETFTFLLVLLTRNLKNNTNIVSNATLTIIGLGVALMGIAASLDILADIDTDKITGNIVNIIKLIGVLVGAVTVLSLINNLLLSYEYAFENGKFSWFKKGKAEDNHLLGPVLTLVALCGAMNVLAKAVTTMSVVPIEKLDGVTAAISSLMITLALMALASKGMGFFSTSSIIIGLIAISIILKQVKKISEQVNVESNLLKDFAKLLGDFTKIVIALVGIAAVAGVVGTRMEAFALSMIGISAAVGGMLYFLSLFDSDMIANALKSELILDYITALSRHFASLVIVLSVASQIFKSDFSNIEKISKGMAHLMIAMSTILLMSYVVGGLKEETVSQMELGIDIVKRVGLLAAAMTGLASIGGDKIPNPLAIGLIMTELLGVIAALSSGLFNIEEVKKVADAIAPVLKSLAAVFAAVALTGAALNHIKVKDAQTMEQQAEIFRHFANAIMYITLLIGEVLGAVGYLAYLGTTDKTLFDKIKILCDNVSWLMLEIAGVLAALSLIKSDANYDQLSKPLLMVTLMIGEILTALYFITKDNTIDANNFIQITTVMVACISALRFVIGTLRNYNSVPLDDIKDKARLLEAACAGLTTIMGALIGLTYMSSAGKIQTDKIIMSIVAMTSVLAVLKGLLKTLTNDRIVHLTNEKVLGKFGLIILGLVGISSAMIALAHFSWPEILSAAGGMSLAMIAYAESIKILATITKDKEIDPNKLKKVIGGSILAISAIAGSLTMLGMAYGNNMGNIGVAAAGIGIAIWGFCESVKKMADLTKDPAFQDEKAWARLTLVMSGCALFILAFTASMAGIQGVDWKSVTATTVGLSLCMLAFAGAITAITKYADAFSNKDNITGIFVSFISAAIYMAVIGTALYFLKETPWSSYEGSIIAMGAVLAEFVGVLFAIKKINASDEEIKRFAAFSAIISGATVLLSIALTALAAASSPELLIGILALGGALVSLSAFMVVFKKINANKEMIIQMAGILVGFAGYLLVVAAAFNQLSLVKWELISSSAVIAIIGVTAAFAALIAVSKGKEALVAIGVLVALTIAIVSLGFAVTQIGDAIAKMGTAFSLISTAFSELQRISTADIATGIFQVANALLQIQNLQLESVIMQLESLNHAFNNLYVNMLLSGYFATEGLSEGILAGINQVNRNMQLLGESALNSFYETVGQHSPWATMIQSGMFGNMGLALGILSGMHYGVDAMHTMGSAVVEAGEEEVVKLDDLYAEVPEKTAQTLIKGTEENQNDINKAFADSGKEAALNEEQGIADTIVDETGNIVELHETAGEMAGTAYGVGATATAVEGTTGTINGIADTFKEMAPYLYDFLGEIGSIIGGNFIQGLGEVVLSGLTKIGGLVRKGFTYIGQAVDEIPFVDFDVDWDSVRDEIDKEYDETAKYLFDNGVTKLGTALDDAFTSFDKFAKNVDLDGLIKKYAPSDSFGDWFNIDDQYEEQIDAITNAMGTDLANAMGTASEASKELSESLYENMDAFGEFDKSTELTASQLIKNMQSQVDGMKNWAAGMAAIKGTISESLYEALMNEGTGSYQKVNAIMNMTSAEREYMSLIYERQMTESIKAAATVSEGVVTEAAKTTEKVANNTQQSVNKSYQAARVTSSKYSQEEIKQAELIVKQYKAMEEAKKDKGVEAKRQQEIASLQNTNKLLDEQMGKLDHINDAKIHANKLGKVEEPVKQYGFETAQNEMKKAQDANKRAMNENIELTEKYKKASALLADVEREKVSNSKKVTKAIQNESAAIEEANKGIIGEASTVVTVLGPAGAQLVELSELEAKQAVTSETMAASFSSLANSIRKYSKEADIGGEEVTQLAKAFVKANPDILAMGMSVEDVTEALLQMEIEMSSVHETIKKQVNDSIKIFEKWDDEFELSEEDLLENMHSQIRGLTKWSGQLEQLSKKGIDAGLLSYLQSLGPQGAEYVNAFAQMTSEELADASATYAHAMNLGDEIADQLVDSYSETGYFLSDGFAEGITNGTGKAEKSAIELGDSALNKLRECLGVNSPSTKGIEIGEWTTIGYADGLVDTKARLYLENKIKALASSTLRTMKASVQGQSWAQLGGDLIRGLANGISSNSTIAVTAVSKAANSVVAAAKKAFNSHSPSRVFEEIGKFDDQGLANGLIKYSYLAYNAANDMAEETLAGFNNGYSGISSIIDWDNLNPVISPTLDLTEVADGVQQLNSMIDETAEARVGFDAYSNQNESAEPRMVFNQYNNSPKALDRIEIYRQTKNLISTSKG